MKRQATDTPYVPHRYVDELPDTALANLGVWRDSLLRGDADANALAHGVLAHVFKDGSSASYLRNPPTLFEDLAVGILRLSDADARRKAARAIFGSAAERDVWELVVACVEEPEIPVGFRDLQGRICARVDHGTWNDTDLAWVQAAAGRQVTDEDLLGMHPFDGDQGDAKELSRRVVRGRRDHRCHWTGLTIPAGEPHLVIKEVMDGEFLVTGTGAWRPGARSTPRTGASPRC